MLQSALSVVQVFISVILIFLVLLHSGGSLMERNLDRWTIFFAVLFVVNTFVLLKI